MSRFDDRRPAPPRPARRRAAVAAGVLAASAAIAGAGEWLAVRPEAAAAARLRASLAALEAENARTERMVADYETFKRDADEIERRFDEALAAVPAEAELAAALQDLERVAAAAGVNLVRFAPGKPNARSKQPEKGAAPIALSARPISILVRSDFASYRDLLDRLAGYPRLLTVERFAVRSAPGGTYTLEASLGLNCYFKEVRPEGAPAPKGAR